VDNERFEAILTAMCASLTAEVQAGKKATNSGEFEVDVRRVLADELHKAGAPKALDPRAQEFPDIVVGNFGIEVKFTVDDSWGSVANSIHESHRATGIDCIYVVFGKMGSGKVTTRTPNPPGPEVRWGKYEDVVYKARTSHRPRFEIDMKGTKVSLFERLGTTYLEFAALPYSEKMVYMRTYARSRSSENIDFWWLEKDLTPYAKLSDAAQREIRAEAALLVPGLVDAGDTAAVLKMAMYMASAKRVLSHDSISVFGADRLTEFQDLEPEMRAAAKGLISGIIEEHWGQQVKPEERLAAWVKMVDALSPGAAAALFGGEFGTPSGL
jgi:hypothetical protein